MTSIKEIGNIKGKKILMRVDFNVPIRDGKILDDFRIKKTIPTIEYLQKKGAILILISHLGDDGSKSFSSIASSLKKYIKNFSFIDTPILLNEAEIVLSKLKAGDVVLLDNIRKEVGEKKNDVSFARGLSRLGDMYVNEAFACSHREHSSIVGLPKFLPSYAGFQLEEEIKNLSMAFNHKNPFVFILGGAKFSTKIPLIKKFLKKADTIFIGGALMNDFFKAQGLEVGKSLVDEENFNLKSIIKSSSLMIPSDVKVISGKNKRITTVNDIHPDETIVDVGPESIKTLEEKIKNAKFILMNGPMGKYEDGFSEATEKILKSIATSKAQSIIGGGDTVELISKLKLEKNLGFVSTGGGATLDFLAKGTLPGIKALK